jgi:hypothetical protein
MRSFLLRPSNRNKGANSHIMPSQSDYDRVQSVELSPTIMSFLNAQSLPYHGSFSMLSTPQFNLPAGNNNGSAFSSFFLRLRQSNLDRVDEDVMEKEDFEQYFEGRPRFRHVYWTEGVRRQVTEWFVVMLLLLLFSVLGIFFLFLGGAPNLGGIG